MYRLITVMNAFYAMKNLTVLEKSLKDLSIPID